MDRQNTQELLTRMIAGSVISKLISVAATLGIADELAKGPKSIDYLAKKFDVHSRSFYRLMRTLASIGIFVEQERDTFGMTPLAEPLQSDVSNSVCNAAICLCGGWAWRSQDELLHSIKTGEPAFDHVFGMGLFDYLDANSAAAEVFNDTMTQITNHDLKAVLATYDFSDINILVDVGGGHGSLISGILKAYPKMQGILADLPFVLEGADKLLASEGVDNRCQRIETDFFKNVPSGGDAYLLRNIIHDWDDEESITILKNCHQQMGKTSKLLLVQAVVPPENEHDPSKILDIEMLLYTKGLERTAEEYESLFNRAGFELTQIIPTDGLPSIIEGKCQ